MGALPRNPTTLVPEYTMGDPTSNRAIDVSVPESQTSDLASGFNKAFAHRSAAQRGHWSSVLIRPRKRAYVSALRQMLRYVRHQLPVGLVIELHAETPAILPRKYDPKKGPIGTIRVVYVSTYRGARADPLSTPLSLQEEEV